MSMRAVVLSAFLSTAFLMSRPPLAAPAPPPDAPIASPAALHLHRNPVDPAAAACCAGSPARRSPRRSSVPSSPCEFGRSGGRHRRLPETLADLDEEDDRRGLRRAGERPRLPALHQGQHGAADAAAERLSPS